MLLALPAAAGAAPRGESGLDSLGDTVVEALASSPAADSLRAVRDSLALLEATRRIEREARRRVAAAQRERPAAEQEPAIRLVDGVAADPSELPPASAGSNGTTVAGKHRMSPGEIFARRPAGDPESTSILLTGIALPPPGAPEIVKRVIDNANAIVGRPYIWGGGHGSFYSHGYDCSGAVSFALFGGRLIPRPLTSGELQHWGAPGPGKWISVYANPGHTYVMIAGLRFDTSGTERGTGPRWHLDSRPPEGFVARHPPGL